MSHPLKKKTEILFVFWHFELSVGVKAVSPFELRVRKHSHREPGLVSYRLARLSSFMISLCVCVCVCFALCRILLC